MAEQSFNIEKCKGFSVPTIMHITADRVSSLLCSAFEGGSNYWYLIAGYEHYTDPSDPAGSAQSVDWHDVPGVDFPHLELPLLEGYQVVITDDDGENYARLNRNAIRMGLHLLAEKHPKHWADFIAENDDGETADTFLQLCLFGNVVYG